MGCAGRAVGVVAAAGAVVALAMGAVPGVDDLDLDRLGGLIPTPQAPPAAQDVDTGAAPPGECGHGDADPAAVLACLPTIDDPVNVAEYRRDDYGERWADVDNNGCGQRDDALLAAVDTSKPYRVETQGGCDHDVVAGTFYDPYTGTTATFDDLKDSAQAQAVPVDHVVPLSLAHRHGAADWDPARKEAFANDLSNLIVTSRAPNSTKSDKAADQWQPPNESFHCDYATRYIDVKSTYALPVEPGERAALAAMLTTC